MLGALRPLATTEAPAGEAEGGGGADFAGAAAAGGGCVELLSSARPAEAGGDARHDGPDHPGTGEESAGASPSLSPPLTPDREVV